MLLSSVCGEIDASAHKRLGHKSINIFTNHLLFESSYLKCQGFMCNVFVHDIDLPITLLFHVLSSLKAALHVSEPPLSGVRDAVLQPV